MVLRVARAVKTFEDVAGQVRTAILQGHFQPGDRLPPQRDLQRQLKVSRFAIMQALHILETSGLVEIHLGARGGVFVRRPDTGPINSSIDLVASMNGLTLTELAEFREVVEGRNAYWAAQRSTREDINALKILMEEIRQLASDRSVPWPALLTLDAAFHAKVAELSKNRLSMAVLQGMMSGLQATLRRVPAQYRTRMVKDLGAIYAAIRAPDPARAETLMRKHIAAFQRVLTRRHRIAPDTQNVTARRQGETRKTASIPWASSKTAGNV